VAAVIDPAKALEHFAIAEPIGGCVRLQRSLQGRAEVADLVELGGLLGDLPDILFRFVCRA
jgi:hypothetical protein